MNIIEISFLLASLISLVLSVILFLLVIIRKSRLSATASGQLTAKPETGALVLQIIGLALLTVSLIIRVIATGHGPFSNMYEFTLAFSWGILAVAFFFWKRYRILMVNTILTIIVVILQIIAIQLPSRHSELVPALQQSLLLNSHVAAAVIAYGSFTMGFVSAVLYIWQKMRKPVGVSHLDMLDEISYQSVKIGFPFMTLVIILGALWADVAWGSYWSWDPKEIASLVTWLIYAGYLHTRLLYKWRGIRSAVLLVCGFCAVLFTFFGNYIFQGLHSYL